MKMTRIKKSLSFMVCVLLIAAMALFTTGCNDNKDEPATNTHPTEITASQSEKTVLGEGAKTFDLTVTDKDGKKSSFEIHTDKTIVGEALQELKLIEGEEGPYGLYIKTVNGVTVDYDTDGKYWAFYINGEYASSGIDKTNIDEAAAYELRVE